MNTIAAVQLQSTGDLNHNLDQINKLTQQAKALGAKMVVLPEECLTLGMHDEAKLALSAKTDHIHALSEIAKRHQCWLVAGSVPADKTGNQYYATCLVFNDQGKIQAQYRKIHMFDVRVSKKQSYCESEHVKPGDQIKVIDTPCGRVLLSICYDVRFPELYREGMLQGAQVILVPSAFTPQTGKVHWHTLLKARAVENLCYVVAPNQNGIRPNGEGTYGHSLIIDPWGAILAQQDQGIGVIVADIDLNILAEKRKEFPALTHHRLLNR